MPIKHAGVYAHVDGNLPVKKQEAKQADRRSQWGAFRDARKEKNTWVSLGKLHENAARVLFLGL